MAYKPVRYKLLTYTLRLCLVTSALCLFLLIPALNAGTATGSRAAQVEAIRLDGGDWGYPTPYAHYPRGPGGFKMCLIFDSLLERGDQGLIPKHIWGKVDNPKTFTKPEAVIGTGPYRLTGYSREHGTYRFEAFKDFWGPAVRVKRLEFIPVSEPILAYQKHEIDLIRVSPDLLPGFQNNPEHKILKSPGFWGYRLLFNRNISGPAGIVQVRQAFAYAIDLDELVAKVARGAALPGRAGILPPDHVMAAHNVRSYDFDPEKAGKLLDQAGFTLTKGPVRTGPDGKPLAFDLLCAGGEVRMAEILKQRLAAVGVDIRIKSCNGKTRDSRVRNQNYDLAIIGHGGWGKDPDYLISHCTGDMKKSNSPSACGGSGLVSPALAQLLKAQRAQTDPEKRRELVVKIQQMAAEEVPEIPLFYTTRYSVFRPATYDGWMFMFDHHSLTHGKLSYLNWKAWR